MPSTTPNKKSLLRAMLSGEPIDLMDYMVLDETAVKFLCGPIQSGSAVTMTYRYEIEGESVEATVHFTINDPDGMLRHKSNVDVLAKVVAQCMEARLAT